MQLLCKAEISAFSYDMSMARFVNFELQG